MSEYIGPTEFAEVWQSTQGEKSAPTLGRVLDTLLLVLAVAIGNALVVLLKNDIRRRRSSFPVVLDGRRKSNAQAA